MAPTQGPFTRDDVFKASLEYYMKRLDSEGQAKLPADVFTDKYALRDREGRFYELTPTDMHHRLAREFARIERNYPNPLSEEYIFSLFEDGYVGPQGSPMFGIGNDFQLVSLSNCSVIPSPQDTMSSIMETGRDMANLYKRRFGVGVDISELRPAGASVSNAAVTSSGAWSFADLYSYITRMVGQQGRRGALMITMDVRHPDIEKFITMKDDLTKVTGANVSVKVSDEFMRAVVNDEQFVLRWPVEATVDNGYGYDEKIPGTAKVQRAVRARDIFKLIASQANKTAEPGVLFWDTIKKNLPLDYYPGFETISTNPCVTGDTWVQTADGPREVTELLKAPFRAVVHGKEYNATPFWPTGVKPVYRVVTEEGHEIRVTANHLIQVEVERTRIPGKGYSRAWVWNEAGDLGPGMRIQLHDHREIAPWEGLGGTFEEGWLVGQVVGDGSYNPEKLYYAQTAHWGDHQEHMAGIAADYVRSLGGVRSDFKGGVVSSGVVLVTKSAALEDLCGKFLSHDGEKTLRPEIERASSAFYRGFLRGIFDADGSVQGDREKGTSVRLSQSDLDRLRVVQRMLLRIGINSTLYANRREAGYRALPSNGEMKNYWCEAQHELVISKENIQRFADMVGFHEPVKSKRLSHYLRTAKRAANTEFFTATVKEIVHDGSEMVYDCTVDASHHSFDGNGMVVHNCGELPLCPYDSCRLISIYLPAFVRNEFSKHAYFDFPLFDKVVWEAQRLNDDLIDLELEKLRAIRAKCDTPDEQMMFDAFIEKCEQGRRTGLGTHGLADALARLCIRYDSEKGIELVDTIYHGLMLNAYKSSVTMAEERGPFPAWNWEIEKECPFFDRLPLNVVLRMERVGRRNGALLTNAPTGSRSIISDNCSSGIEPVYLNSYTRKRKVDHSKEDSTPDFVDATGDAWVSYKIYHPNVERYIRKVYEANGKIPFEYRPDVTTSVPRETVPFPQEFTFEEFREWIVLPDYFVTTADIDYIQRVKMQATITHYIDHSVSSTLNLPSTSTPEDVEKIYLEAWELGCKGVTVYRDGSREAQVLSAGAPNTETPELGPKLEPFDLEALRAQLIEELRREYADEVTEAPKHPNRPTETTGPMFKASFTNPVAMDERKVYVFIGKNDAGQPVEAFVIDTQGHEDFQPYAEALGRLTSLALKYNVPVRDIVNQLYGLRGGSISYTEGVHQSVPSLLAKQLQKAQEAFESPKEPAVTVNGPVTLGAGTVVRVRDGETLKFGDVVTSAPDSTFSFGNGKSKVAFGTENGGIPGASTCPSCKQKTFVTQGGCPTCVSCGFAKCS